MNFSCKSHLGLPFLFLPGNRAPNALIDNPQICRGFFRYDYEQNLLDVDFSALVPKDNFKKQPKLPSTYSVTEVEKLIASIDRGDAIGKRNYAVVLLAARLGLRASD